MSITSSLRRQQQQQQHQSGIGFGSGKLSKLKNVSATVSFALVLVGLSLLVYVRSFLALHDASGPVSSIPLDTLPVVIALSQRQYSHSRTFENVSDISSSVTAPLVVATRRSNEGTSNSPAPAIERGSQRADDGSGVSSPKNSTLEKVGDGSSSNSLEEHGNHPGANNSNAANAPPPGIDLQELLAIYSSYRRRQWLKQHWAGIPILHSDSKSEQFPRRIKAFFVKPGQRCSSRFFLLWISPLNSYGSRERRCLESILKHHPDACVAIISRSLDSDQGHRVLEPLTARGYKVKALTPDLPFLFNSTPEARWWLRSLKSGQIDPGEINFKQNLSNILRLLLLYRFGGIYLDSDVLVLSSLAKLTNSIGAQTEDSSSGEWQRLNNAVLAFDRRHPVLHSFIKEFALTFNGSKWGHNGPYLTTRVLDRVRRADGTVPCGVVRTRVLYPVTWSHIPALFRGVADEKERLWRDEKVRRLKSESLAIHLWNKETKKLRVEPGSVIDELFHRECVVCDDEDEQQSSSPVQ